MSATNDPRNRFGEWAALCLSLVLAGCLPAQSAPRPNVLLICVDDLKPLLGCYGDGMAKSPNMDRLAGRGTRFAMAYCNQSVCAPSRNNLLLGSRSTSIGVYGLSRIFRTAVPEAVTLPQYFIRHGYRAESVGKVLHTGHGNHDDAASWSVPPFHEMVVEYLDPENSAGGASPARKPGAPPDTAGHSRPAPRSEMK